MVGPMIYPKSTASIPEGGVIQFSIDESNMNQNYYQWSSSNSDIVSINSKGEASGLKLGSAIISYDIKNDKTHKFKTTVEVFKIVRVELDEVSTKGKVVTNFYQSEKFKDVYQLQFNIVALDPYKNEFIIQKLDSDDQTAKSNLKFICKNSNQNKWFTVEPEIINQENKDQFVCKLKLVKSNAYPDQAMPQTIEFEVGVQGTSSNFNKFTKISLPVQWEFYIPKQYQIIKFGPNTLKKQVSICTNDKLIISTDYSELKDCLTQEFDEDIKQQIISIDLSILSDLDKKISHNINIRNPRTGQAQEIIVQYNPNKLAPEEVEPNFSSNAIELNSRQYTTTDFIITIIVLILTYFTISKSGCCQDQTRNNNKNYFVILLGIIFIIVIINGFLN
eukprot:TRINITY_DN3986_c0_g2_i2.p1 TRINITY_DN3986_c0_g2~~TRINITY_DN3986_c0_g2_i2.p1  ORF type:complete len:390 (-),score=64.10 TRINITY_DN3986_c0_g2_i2:189-1358(-)